MSGRTYIRTGLWISWNTKMRWALKYRARNQNLSQIQHCKNDKSSTVVITRWCSGVTLATMFKGRSARPPWCMIEAVRVGTGACTLHEDGVLWYLWVDNSTVIMASCLCDCLQFFCSIYQFSVFIWSPYFPVRLWVGVYVAEKCSISQCAGNKSREQVLSRPAIARHYYYY